MIDMIPVDSSHIVAIGFAEATAELHIEFSRPQVVTYAYYIVKKDVFEGLLRAESKGHYFNDFIKGRYPYRPVG